MYLYIKKGDDMRVEIAIAREKFSNLPKNAASALKTEMEKRLMRDYDDVEIIVKQASSDGLSVFRAKNKDADREAVEKVLQETWESADEWFF